MTGQIAALAAMLFAGAALYVSFVEQPVRLSLASEAMVEQWRKSYARAAPIQAGLAIIAGVAGLLAWQGDGNQYWLVGALLILANWPVTLLVIKPVNDRLKVSPAGLDPRPLVVRWGRLHALRSALGFAAALIFLLQL